MNRRGFFKFCLAAAGAMLLPAAKAAGIESQTKMLYQRWVLRSRTVLTIPSERWSSVVCEVWEAAGETRSDDLPLLRVATTHRIYRIS